MISVEKGLPGEGGRRSARCEYRTYPEVKQAISRAAARVGVDETTFVMNAAYRAAREVEMAEQQTVIPPEYQKAFLEALDAPATVLTGLAAMAAEDDRSAEDE